MRPTLYLLPGILNDARLWHRQQLALQSAWDIRVPSLHHRPSIPELAREILAQAPASFALAGLSMGGYVALEIMRQDAGRVTHLALLATSARPDCPERRRQREAMIALSRKGKFLGVSPRLMPGIIHPSRVHQSIVTAPIYAMAAEMGREAFIRQETAALHRHDQREILPSISCPTLIIVGDSDRLTPPEYSHEMHRLIPGASLQVLERCGHLPPLERPKTTTALLKNWLHNAANR